MNILDIIILYRIIVYFSNIVNKDLLQRHKEMRELNGKSIYRRRHPEDTNSIHLEKMPLPLSLPVN